VFGSSMEEILSRFSHLSEEIFNLLDNNSLRKSRKVDRYWNVYIAEQKFYSIRIIKTTLENFQEVGPEWNKLFIKSTTKTITDLQKAVQLFYLDQKISPEGSQCSILCSLNMPNGITPLHIAAYRGDLGLLRMILDENHQEYQTDDWGCSPLHYAAHNGHLEMCQYIMEEFEETNDGNNFGETPLHELAHHGNSKLYEIVVNNLSLDEILVDKNPADDSGWTPLHVAALHGHLEICDFLMGIVKNKNPPTNAGLFPLYFAANNKHMGICELITKKLDDENPRVNRAGLLYSEVPN
jgi:hypothetical protein